MDSIWKNIESKGDSSDGVGTITQAMEIEGTGVVIRVHTCSEGMGSTFNVTEALTFVPWAKVEEVTENNKVVGYKLVGTNKF